MESFNQRPSEPGKGTRPSESVPVGEEQRRQMQLASQDNPECTQDQQILAAIASAFVQNSTQGQQSQMATIGLGALIKSLIEGAAHLQQVQALQRMQNLTLSDVQLTQLSAASHAPQAPTSAAVASSENTAAATEVTRSQYGTGDASISRQANEPSGKVQTDGIDTSSTGATFIPGLLPQPPEGCTIARCKARGMPPDHNLQTAYFVIPDDIEHGQELLCSYPDCRIAGCKFCFCIYCRLPVAKRNFKKRHDHGEFASNKDEEHSLEEQPSPVAEGKNYASSPDRRQPAVGRLKQDGSGNARCQSAANAVAISASTSSRNGSSSGSSDLAVVQSEFPPDVVAKTTSEMRRRWAALLGSRPPITNDEEVRHWLIEVLAASALAPELPRAPRLSASNISLLSSALGDCKRDQDGFSSAARTPNSALSDSFKDQTGSSASEGEQYQGKSDSTSSEQGTTSLAVLSSKTSCEKKMTSSRHHSEQISRKLTRGRFEEEASDPENQLEAESTGDSSQSNEDSSETDSCGRKRRQYSYSSSDEYTSDFSHKQASGRRVRRRIAYKSCRGHSSDDQVNSSG